MFAGKLRGSQKSVVSVRYTDSALRRHVHLLKYLNSPETLEASDMVVALVPLLEPDIPDATVPPSPPDFSAGFRKLAVAFTYVKNGTYK